MFSAYLRGIETETHLHNWGYFTRFSAYLRGIETVCRGRNGHFVQGFQPTYEELKLRRGGGDRHVGDVFSAYLRGIETPKMNNIAPGSVGFQPTYEELKPQCTFSRPTITSSVFSLPMRNWNTASRRCCRWRSTFFSLPMRNWNQAQQVGFDEEPNSFQPTYEELKQNKKEKGK